MDRLVVSLMFRPKNPPPHQEVVLGLLREFAEYYHLDIADQKRGYQIREHFLMGSGVTDFCSWMRERHGLCVRPFKFESTSDMGSTVIMGYGFEFDKDENLTACLLKMGFNAA